MSYLLDQKNLQFSKMFMFFPSTLDQQEELNQYSNNVNLHPIDVSYDQLKAYHNVCELVLEKIVICGTNV